MHCSPPDSSVHGVLQARILELVTIPSSRRSSNPGIKPRSSTLQADTLLSEPPGKPVNTGVGSHSLLQGIFPAQGLNWVSWITDGFFTIWATRESPSHLIRSPFIFFFDSIASSRLTGTSETPRKYIVNWNIKPKLAQFNPYESQIFDVL